MINWERGSRSSHCATPIVQLVKRHTDAQLRSAIPTMKRCLEKDCMRDVGRKSVTKWKDEKTRSIRFCRFPLSSPLDGKLLLGFAERIMISRCFFFSKLDEQGDSGLVKSTLDRGVAVSRPLEFLKLEELHDRSATELHRRVQTIDELERKGRENNGGI